MNGRFYFFIMFMTFMCSCQFKRTSVEVQTLDDDSVSIEEIVVKEMKIYNLDSCLYPSLNSFIDRVKTLPQYANRKFFIYMECYANDENHKSEMTLGALLESDKWFYRGCDRLVRYKGYDILPIILSDSFSYIIDTGQYDTLNFIKINSKDINDIEEYFVVVKF